MTEITMCPSVRPFDSPTACLQPEHHRGPHRAGLGTEVWRDGQSHSVHDCPSQGFAPCTEHGSTKPDPLADAHQALFAPTETEQRRRATKAERECASPHGHVTSKTDGKCAFCGVVPTKVVVRREVLVDADLDPVSLSMETTNIDLGDNQTLTDWLAEQTKHGETAMDFARELDLFEGVSIYIQLVEHYDDGSHTCVERITWTDGDADKGRCDHKDYSVRDGYAQCDRCTEGWIVDHPAYSLAVDAGRIQPNGIPKP